MDGGQGLLRGSADPCDLPPEMCERIDQKNAITNVRRMIPFAACIFLIEVLNQLALLLSDAYPALRRAYLSAGAVILLLTFCAIVLGYRTLRAPRASRRRCQILYRGFWALFTLNMLVFVYLELRSRGSTNNYIYLLILTAAFPLLSWREALVLFGFDTAVMIPLAVGSGFPPQQLMQFPLIALFAMVLSRMLYNAHRMNDMMLEKLAVSNQKLTALARTDPLTGLLNRRGVQDQLLETLSQAHAPTSVALLMIDIDLFKNYNDRFGHEQGDQCLMKIAGAVQRCVRRPTDLAARFGGEEFLVALTGGEASAALETARQLQRDILDLALSAAADTVHRHVTVSIGIAASETPLDFTALYEEADKALYRAKNAGRNRIAWGGTIYRSQQDA